MAASASANIDFDNSIFEVESQAVELVPQASPSPPTWRERAKNFGGKICGGLNRVRESWLFRAMLVVGLVSTAVNSYYADIQLKKAYGDIDALVEGHLLLVEHMDFLESEVSGLSVTATPAIPPDAGKDRDMDVVAVHAALRSALVNIQRINEHGINGVQPYMSGRDFVALMSVMNDKTTLSLQPSLPSLDFL
nr:hypothetical protein TetV2_00602 [Oceanusvirus sp.]